MDKIPSLEELLNYGDEYQYPDLIMSDYFRIDEKRKKDTNKPQSEEKQSQDQDTEQSTKEQGQDQKLEQTEEEQSKEQDTEQSTKEQSQEQDTEQSTKEQGQDQKLEQSTEEQSKDQDIEQSTEEKRREQDTKQSTKEQGQAQKSKQATEEQSKEQDTEQSTKEQSQDQESEQTEEEQSQDRDTEQSTKEQGQAQKSEQSTEDQSQEQDIEQSTKEQGQDQKSEQTEEEQGQDQKLEQSTEEQSQEQDTEQSTKEQSQEQDTEQSTKEQSQEQDTEQSTEDRSQNQESDQSSEKEENDFEDLINNYEGNRVNDKINDGKASRKPSGKLDSISPTKVYKVLRKLVSLSYEQFQKGTYRQNKKEIVKHCLTRQKFRIMDDFMSPIEKPDVYVFDLSPSNNNSLEMYVNAISSLAIKDSWIYLTYNDSILRKIIIKSQNPKGIDIRKVVKEQVTHYNNFDCINYEGWQSLYDELKNIKDRKIYIFSDFDILYDISRLSYENPEIVWFSTERNHAGIDFLDNPTFRYIGYYVDTASIDDIEKYVLEGNKMKYKSR